jgi:molybdenum cofactor guanylyltransferase
MGRLLSCTVSLRPNTGLHNGSDPVLARGLERTDLEEISAFVLAGGKSSRMGAEKALLAIGGATLLARALAVAGQVSRNIFIVGEKAKFAGFGAVIEDSYLECGPLAGIHAALKNSSTERNLMLAVDLPFVNAALLRFLLLISQQDEAVVTVPRVHGRLQPLCAVYRRTFSVPAEESLRQGAYKIDRLFEQITVRIVEQTELENAGFSPASFENVNTPAEWTEAKRRFSQRVS